MNVKEKIRMAGCELFAMKGFYDTSVEEICIRAGESFLAIKNRLPSKEILYVDSWQYSFRESFQDFLSVNRIEQVAPAEVRLYKKILFLMRKIVDPRSHHSDFMCWEKNDPTGLLEDVKKKSVKKMQEGFLSNFLELLGKKADESQILFCEKVILNQCFSVILSERCRRKCENESVSPINPLLFVNIEFLALQYALNGLSYIRGLLTQSKRTTYTFPITVSINPLRGSGKLLKNAVKEPSFFMKEGVKNENK